MKKQNLFMIIITALLVIAAVVIYIFMGDKSISSQQTIYTSKDTISASEVGEVIYKDVHFNIHSGLSVIKEFGEPTFYLRDVIKNDPDNPRTNKDSTFYYYSFNQTGNEDDNYDIYITLCEENGVTQVYDYIIGTKNVEFTNGISIGSTIDEVVAVMGEPTSMDDSRSAILYNYETNPVDMHFIFHKNRLFKVMVSNNAIVDKFCPD